MSRLSQQKSNAANIIETAFNEENILSLLETINIDTFDSINNIKEIKNNSINK